MGQERNLIEFDNMISILVSQPMLRTESSYCGVFLLDFGTLRTVGKTSFTTSALLGPYRFLRWRSPHNYQSPTPKSARDKSSKRSCTKSTGMQKEHGWDMRLSRASSIVQRTEYEFRTTKLLSLVGPASSSVEDKVFWQPAMLRSRTKRSPPTR